MQYENPNAQPELHYEKRKSLVSAYEDWNRSCHWSAHLTLRPNCSTENRKRFSEDIGCMFADVERTIVGNKVYGRKKHFDRFRIYRAVYIEQENTDIHAHILVHIPTPETHVKSYWGVDLEKRLCEAWSRRHNLDSQQVMRNFLWQPITTDGIHGYPVKECLSIGNTDNWDDRSSRVPKN